MGYRRDTLFCPKENKDSASQFPTFNKMKQQTSITMSPGHNNNDMPVACPKRQPSFTTSLTTILTVQTRQFSRLSSSSCSESSCSVLYSPTSRSSHTRDTLGVGSNFYLSFGLSETDLEEAIKEKSVRFAPYSPTFTVMCLEDYTEEEIDNCWYSRDEIHHMHEADSQKNNKHSHAHHDVARWKA